MLCGVCSGVMHPFEQMLRSKAWKRTAEGIVDYTFCEVFGMFFDQHMCTGLMGIWADYFWQPVSLGLLSRDKVCTESIGWCRTPTIRKLSLKKYVERLLAQK